MIYRPPERRSRLADWSRTLGAFAVPLLVIAVIGHRFGRFATDPAVVLVACAFALAALALLCGLAALAVIWRDGRPGAGHAVVGLIWAALVLTPAAALVWQWVAHPRLVDLSTDALDPPLFHAAAFERAGRANTVRPPDSEERARLRALVPDVVSRRYSIGSDLLFSVVRRQVEAEGWTVAELQAPRGDGDRGRIEAVARSLIFGFRDDVVLRVLPEPSGARIDLRSSTRWGIHDLGRGARRIRAFLEDLDKAVVDTYGR
ncbi:DUF1499 domain-containing protein [Siculibacillus lacustris]|nr:DUF1499 domain-containing protein [Siculibacillus lacustris]